MYIRYWRIPGYGDGNLALLIEKQKPVLTILSFKADKKEYGYWEEAKLSWQVYGADEWTLGCEKANYTNSFQPSTHDVSVQDAFVSLDKLGTFEFKLFSDTKSAVSSVLRSVYIQVIDLKIDDLVAKMLDDGDGIRLTWNSSYEKRWHVQCENTDKKSSFAFSIELSDDGKVSASGDDGRVTKLSYLNSKIEIGSVRLERGSYSVTVSSFYKKDVTSSTTIDVKPRIDLFSVVKRPQPMLQVSVILLFAAYGAKEWKLESSKGEKPWVLKSGMHNITLYSGPVGSFYSDVYTVRLYCDCDEPEFNVSKEETVILNAF